jgi:hypothetical protein
MAEEWIPGLPEGGFSTQAEVDVWVRKVAFERHGPRALDYIVYGSHTWGDGMLWPTRNPRALRDWSARMRLELEFYPVEPGEGEISQSVQDYCMHEGIEGPWTVEEEEPPAAEPAPRPGRRKGTRRKSAADAGGTSGPFGDVG